MERLLTVGPLPPPPSGATVSFQLFCDWAVSHRAQAPIAELEIVDSSPKRIKKNRSIASFGNLQQATRLLWQVLRRIGQADALLIFGSNGFLLSLTPLLVLTAKLFRKHCFIRSFGGSLDQFAAKLPGPLRWLLLFGFRQSDGLIVETRLLHRHFASILGTDKVTYVPGYRIMPDFVSDEAESGAKLDTPQIEQLRLLFIAWVRPEKGVSILLDALSLLTEDERSAVVCDIYGPIVEEYRTEFEERLERTATARYRGVLEPERVLETMRTYDALLFPSFYKGEGHPGVVIESMAAGIPVITTRFRSIPEIVDDGVNGLLMTPEDPNDLAATLSRLIADQTPLIQMGQENWQRRHEFDVDIVIPRLIQTLLEVS